MAATATAPAPLTQLIASTAGINLDATALSIERFSGARLRALLGEPLDEKILPMVDMLCKMPDQLDDKMALASWTEANGDPIVQVFLLGPSPMPVLRFVGHADSSDKDLVALNTPGRRNIAEQPEAAYLDAVQRMPRTARWSWLEKHYRMGQMAADLWKDVYDAKGNVIAHVPVHS